MTGTAFSYSCGGDDRKNAKGISDVNATYGNANLKEGSDAIVMRKMKKTLFAVLACSLWGGAAFAAVVPDNPNPMNGATDVPLSTVLGWNRVVDASSDVTRPVYYDVWFGDNGNNMTRIAAQTTNLWAAPPTDLEYETPYYWFLVISDDVSKISGDMWMFTTGAVPEGNFPTDPWPADNATEIATDATLRWDCGLHGKVTYRVKFGASSQTFTTIYQGTERICTPVNMEKGKAYYWQVEALLPAGAVYVGPTWRYSVITPYPETPNVANSGCSTGVGAASALLLLPIMMLFAKRRD